MQRRRTAREPRTHARAFGDVREGVAGLPGDETNRVSQVLLRRTRGPPGHPLQRHQPAAHPATPVQVLRQRPQPVIRTRRDGQPEQKRHLDVVG